ncbi:DUF7114 family protein [Natrialba asiatica]|uniref:Uncharacterized protein n=1 Tax=Natrialba asiatica (strain ATCC 700177 / DSM 12278 / JCM 9576 / FERM P-10747 / NBRC 102637 / 172P1) TaxID=29540 RepID=M0AJL9_NATA1|nr:hypothetical protein [Natrialba asiatica]ELY98915.1 hypothetical protein C481_16396 [Natrialba asiatica DSM 12278]
MDKADSCRRTAVDAVADVEPPRLASLLDTVLEDASMLPGVLTIESATIHTPELSSPLDDSTPKNNREQNHPRRRNTDRSIESTELDTDTLLTHAAGVQLIYEGLRLTRGLAHEDSWCGDSAHANQPKSQSQPQPQPQSAHQVQSQPENQTQSQSRLEHHPQSQSQSQSDLQSQPQSRSQSPSQYTDDLTILAADILVARGFSLLARTDAADKAVHTVQAFGRDQTRRTELTNTPPATSTASTQPSTATNPTTETTSSKPTTSANAPKTTLSPHSIDTNLERDILELAIRTGAATADTSPSASALELATTLTDALLPTDTLLPTFPPVTDDLAELDHLATDQNHEKYSTGCVPSATDP